MTQVTSAHVITPATIVRAIVAALEIPLVGVINQYRTAIIAIVAMKLGDTFLDTDFMSSILISRKDMEK
ncbi:hypothetical protein [Haladaptatus sp. R4]|uniref:hypothetical protein n=1 Tax=Haladaptatus sp. R4 TaxID=1679489 RepID=UPI001CBB0E73|nr:hypothetical protein [Haladaptatus sp. R4]